MALNEKQRRFCDEFLANGGNATQAYKKVYPGAKNDNVAAVNANRLLRNAKVQKYLDEHSTAMEDHNSKIATAEELQERLTAFVREEAKETVVSSSGMKVEIPIGIKDQLKAIDMMLRLKGMYRDKVDLNVSPIVLQGYEDVEN